MWGLYHPNEKIKTEVHAKESLLWIDILWTNDILITSMQPKKKKKADTLKEWSLSCLQIVNHKYSADSMLYKSGFLSLCNSQPLGADGGQSSINAVECQQTVK